MQKKQRMVIGISGASGAILGIELLKALRQFGGWETHLILSSGARRTIQLETAYSVADVEKLADVVHRLGDIGASVASGTFKTAGMVIVPCSMKTVAGIAHGYSENLLLRAADVTLKERRKLVLVPRETPFNLIHLRNMTTAAEAGAIVLPPMLSFYLKPQRTEELVAHIIGKILSLFDIEQPGFQRWGEQQQASSS
jgi:4-hydroxy-3-polyprenylbenzoate decarboxylase